MSKTLNLVSRFANETNEPDGTARAGNPASWGRKTGSALRLLLAVTMSAGVLSTGPITRAVAAEETAPAAPHEGKSSDEIARELANPNTPLASLTFKNQIRWFDGDLPNANHQDNYTLLFQPVFPFTLPETPTGGQALIFVRPAVPLLFDQPAFDAGKMDFKPVTALGDIGFDVAFGVTEKNGLIWALGMVGTLPTATSNDVSGKQLRLGPEGFVAKFEKWGIYGFFPSHQWTATGWDDRYFSTTTLQPFLIFLPGDAWAVGTKPIMNYDWAASEWNIPLSLSASKTTSLGGTPLKLEVELNYYVARPDVFATEWLLSINITPVVRNILDTWIQGLF